MDSMDIDSPPDSVPLTPCDRVIKRLVLAGVPEKELLEFLQPGLVAFVKDNNYRLPELVSAILPPDEEVVEVLQKAKSGSKRASVSPTMKGRFRESMVWLQWLMFEGEPGSTLKYLSKLNVGQRGVCGAVWGSSDIAYRCRTCEHDETCAICVPCFQNGNHENHDYSVIYTGGGCCDCGDETAWKRDGFCSKHKGAEQIHPLPEEFASSVGPVLEVLFGCWKNKLSLADTICREYPRTSDSVAERRKVANELTLVVVETLLEFCKYSESLLSFVSRKIFSSAGLLELLVRAERFLSDAVVRKLHELLLKLLGEPVFKYEFAKAFVSYYPIFVSGAIKESTDHALKKYPLLPTFSVQIFTVPTLTPRLVEEMNLLLVLLGCLEDIFISCVGEGGHLQVIKLGNLYETTLRIVEDVRFVMSHVVVPKYVTHEKRAIVKTWIRFLSFVQGMNPQRRETGIHIEEENENMQLPFALCHSIANIHTLLVAGAFSDAREETGGEIFFNTYKQNMEEQGTLRNAEVGRILQESSGVNPVVSSSSSACALEVSGIKSESVCSLLIPSSVSWLTYECLKAMENWLEVNNTSGDLLNVSSTNSRSISVSDFLTFKKTFSCIRYGKSIFSSVTNSSEDRGRHFSSPVFKGSSSSADLDNGQSASCEAKTLVTSEVDFVGACNSAVIEDNAMQAESTVGLRPLHVLSLSDWPDIVYDVSSQDISAHIPFHRLLALLLQKSLGRCYDGSSVTPDTMNVGSANLLSVECSDFFQYMLRGCHPYGFSAFVMEHPLRIRVFCAEVHAGMWRKNGDTAILSCECYRSVPWSGLDLELDLFLLQCCAALAPADLYVSKILERFGLSNYLALNLERCSEYEPVLVQEMLTLIIQIVKERRFCGLTTAESLKRELVYKLAIGDATHSQLVKSLPPDLSNFDQLQEILDTVAQYSNPSGINQGKYSLRWSYWKDLDLYHPRWSLRDLQVAEERYLRFSGVSALTTQLPRWTTVYPPFKDVAKIATCKMVLEIVRVVVFYAVFTDKLADSPRAPDGVLLTTLHLLSLALDICLQLRECRDQSFYSGDPVPIVAFAGEEIGGGLHDGASEQSLLSLLVLLMRMHKKENLGNVLEAGICNLSSLIESLLKKFAEIDSGCLAKLQRLAPEVISYMSTSVQNGDTSMSESVSDSEKRKARARERQAAILEKMRAEQSKFLASVNSSGDECSKLGEVHDSEAGHDSEEYVQEVCSLCHDSNSKTPVSFLILLQKSRLLGFVDRGPLSWEQVCRSEKEPLGFVDRGPLSWEQVLRSEKEPVVLTSNNLTDQFLTNTSTYPLQAISEILQNAVNEFACNGQPGEADAFLDFIKVQFPSVRNIQVPCISNDERERTSYTFETLEEDIYISIRREMLANVLHSDFTENDEKIAEENQKRNKHVLLGKYVVALKGMLAGNSPAHGSTSSHKGLLELASQLLAYDRLGPDDCDGIYLSSCGHAVHQGCLDRYLSSLKERHVRRIVFEGGHIADPNQGEFLCPVCRRLANSILPTVQGDFQKVWKQPLISTVSSPEAADPLVASSENIDSLRLQEALCLLQSVANMVGKGEILEVFPLQRDGRIRPDLEPVSCVLSKMYKQDKLLGSSRAIHLMMLWNTLKYTLVSTEIASRSGKQYVTPTYSLEALYKELDSSSGFILSMILKIVQSARSKNSLDVLQRFRGIQLFAESICYGVSLDYPSDISQHKGDVLCMLKHANKEVSVSETQFWNQASYPVLASDPFSSFIWVLFCLPYPFLSCEESFFSLVHLFYVVSVAQTIITYCGKYHCKINELGTDDCLIMDICKLMGESGCAQLYFVSNYIEPSANIKDTIRKFSFPYMRRCALLWKLLNSSFTVPFCDTALMLDGSRVSGDMINSPMELDEIQQLEIMFKIPSLDVVLKDKMLCSLVVKWFHHFHKEFEVSSFQSIMHSSPAVPFRLMHLPYVYQDLLQRYIKQRCPDCKSNLDDPALCLLCGRLCSSSWKPCCRESGCQNHAMSCGAGVGVFLVIRRTTILLQRSARQSPWPSLYLDAFGEEDIEIHRGKPLYLNQERYSALTYMVASHGLDQSSKVLRQTSIGSFFME